MALSIHTIASENNFLRVLARAVLRGFPVGATEMPLSCWTILVPNRRSARALHSILLEESGAGALLLPRIQPIGDIDEDLIADSLPQEGVHDAMAKTDHLHAILLLLTEWAEQNVDAPLAQDVLQSGAQAFTLASSLQDLVDQFETEEVFMDALEDVYDLDLAGHRKSILDVLRIVTAQLPKLLARDGLSGPSARRNLMIRLEARRISGRQLRGPIIAAGSTGTNPATRDLMRAIASHPMGAVVLPGLDLDLDDHGWNAITPEHPQFALKTLLEYWGIPRSEVQVMGAAAAHRMWLMSQTLRPAAVADTWITALKDTAPEVRLGLSGVELVEAADRNEEAEVIALRLRKHVFEAGTKAALVTPDRDLVIRVKAALKRWNLEIDDSAGEPLTHGGRAALLVLLLRSVEDGFSASSLFALLHQAECTLGLPREQHLARVRALELAGFRGLPAATGLALLATRVTRRRASLATKQHAHPLLKRLTDDMWTGATMLALQLDALLTPLADKSQRSLASHVERLGAVLDALSPPPEVPSPGDELAHDVLEALREGSRWHPVGTLSKAQHSIVRALSRERLRPPLADAGPLAIYGLDEARFNEAELVILGGLTEGVWPAHPDTGPWLNRPMREGLKVQQPERHIGRTAHDFVQNFGHAKVMVTWPRRLGGAPAIASRWVLRLKAVMAAAGLDVEEGLSTDMTAIARRLDAPLRFQPLRRPKPTPPLSVRPTHFSVTRVEKLVRDSYWVYARSILKLVPLDGIGEDVDAALRGSLIHGALQGWTAALPDVPPRESLKLLLARGEELFRPYIDMPEVARFWWPRFERMAQEFVEKDRDIRRNTANTLTELEGKLAFDVADIGHSLTARADRIDIEENGDVRIIDYKSGAVPSIAQMKSGFAPQLTLEALIAMKGGFKGLHSRAVGEIAYIAVGGTAKGVEVTSLPRKSDVAVEAAKAFAGLVNLLSAFQHVETAYIPRHNPKFEDDISDYDHLSRKLEWQLEGTAL